MKILVSSDWHGDALTAGVPRRADIIRHVDKMLEEEFNLFVFGGDLTDPDTPGAHAAIEYACTVAARLADRGIISCWVAGNHDTVEDGLGTTTLSALRGIEVGGSKLKSPIRVFNKPSATLLNTPAGTVAFVALPYPSLATHYDPADFVKRLRPLPEGTPCLVMGHLWMKGDEGSGSESTDMARGRPVYWPVKELEEKFPNALLVGGHYHRQGFMGGVLMVGTMDRLTAGEQLHHPRYLLLEVP